MLNSELMLENLCAQGYHLIENFLDTTSFQQLQLLAQDKCQQGLFKAAKIGINNQLQRNETIRGDAICWIDEEEVQPALQTYLTKIKQLAQCFNQSLFLGLNELETHFAIYQPGSFYKKHIDQFATAKDRKISYVYYLNNDWSEAFGGQLKLYNQEDELINSITPKGNRFICFNSELPHEVALTHQTRYSITGWMKSITSALLRD